MTGQRWYKICSHASIANIRHRFDDKRDHFFKFLGFWVAQMLWVCTPCEDAHAGLVNTSYKGLDRESAGHDPQFTQHSAI